MDGCVRERFLVVDDFLSDEQGRAMRADIDAHFANPSEHLPATHQLWNYWYVPGSYTYLRTTPEKLIELAKVEAFVAALRNWAGLNLGLAGVTWPYLSLYVPGCVQGLHNDSVNGRLGYVFSLTRDDRKTTGGETLLMHEGDLFRSLLDKPAAGVGLFDLVEPRFNRLTLFDDRIPHAVQRVEGPMDPLEGRFVLHGHISEAGIVAQGGLHADAIQQSLADVLPSLLRGHGTDARGPLSVRLEIDASGEVRSAVPIFDRLASSSGSDLGPVRSAALDRLASVRFPAAASPTRANVPLIF